MSDSKRDALETRATKLVAEIERLSAIDAPTPGEFEHMERAIVEANRLRQEIVAHDTKLDELREYVNTPGHVLPGGADDGPNVIRRGPTREEPINRFDQAGLKARALRALEKSSSKTDGVDADKVHNLIRHRDGAADAEYVLVSSDPAYRSAFTKMLRDPRYWHCEEVGPRPRGHRPL